MALKWLRDNLKHLKFVLWGVVLVFVLLVFVDWGAGRSGGSRDQGNLAVRVGSSGLTEEDFLRRLSNMDENYRRSFGDQWDELRKQIDLPGMVREDYILSELRSQEAERIGLMVTDKELQKEIIDQFGGEDNFIGTERYEMMIRRSMHMAPRDWEALVRKQLLVEKLLDLASRSIYISDAEAEEDYRSKNERAVFDAIQLGYEGFLAEVEIADSEIHAYYDEHSEELRRDEQRIIRYLLIETSRLRRLLDVEDSEIEEYYQSHADEFITEESANARHILFRVAPDADQAARAEAQLRAEQVTQLARQGVDFGELASIHSEDPGSKDKGGDLGWFSRGQMVKAFEDAVFNGKPGEILGPVKSEYGFHIIKVERFRPPSQKPLEEVRSDIRFTLVEGRAAAEAELRATALESRLRNRPKAEAEADDQLWQELADEDEAVVLNISPAFTQEEPIQGLNDPDLTGEAFAFEAGELGGKRAVSRGWIVWQVKEIKPEGIPPLDDVSEDVRQLVQRGKALDLAVARAEELAAQWRAGADVELLAESFGSSVVRADEHRRGATNAELRTSSALDDTIFSAAAGEVIGPVRIGDQAAVVARIESLDLVDDEEVAANLETVRSQLVTQQANQLLSAIIVELRRDTVITWDTELMERYSGKE
jgi:peptidyl-prolyl cis-trans isomerase D